MTPLRVGIIGAGSFVTRRHMPDFKQDSRVAMVAACRRDPAALAKVADHFDIPGRFADWREMLDKTPLDAVLIATPHDQHEEQARVALGRGLHVLLEKPMALAAAKAQYLCDLAHAKNRCLAVAFNAPYWAHTLAMRDGVAAGKIGALEAVTIRWTGSLGAVFGKIPMPEKMPGVVPPTLFRADPIANGGGNVMDGGGHLISELLWVTGKKPLEVSAIMDSTPDDMRAAITVRLEDNILATIVTVGDSSYADKRMRSTYDGALGSVVAVGYPFLIAWSGPDGEEVQKEAELPPVPSPVADWVDCIQSGRTPLGSADHGVLVTRVLAAVYESAGTGRSVVL